MFHLDLKELLLTSLSAEKTLHLHKKFTIGKKCFTVVFHVSGRHLLIKKVKISKKDNIHSKQIRQRLFSMNIRQKAISYAKKFTPNPMLRCSKYGIPKLYNGPPKSINKETMTLAESTSVAGDGNVTYSDIGMIDCGLQIMPKTLDYGSDCRDIIWPVDKEQQTFMVENSSVSTQTYSSLLSIGIQASSGPMLSFPTQTIRYTKIAGTQTDPNYIYCSGTLPSNFIDLSGKIGGVIKELLSAILHCQCNHTINLQNCEKMLDQLHTLIKLKIDYNKNEVSRQSDLIKSLITAALQTKIRSRSERIHKYCKLMKPLKMKKTKKEQLISDKTDMTNTKRITN